MRFSILHTSARPEKWREIYDAWVHYTADKPEEVEYILVVDRKWGFTELPELASQGFSPRPQDKVFWQTGNGYVDGVNLAACAAMGDVLVVNADDQYPADHWDTALENVMADPGNHARIPYTAEDEFVIAVATGTPNEKERGVVVMPIVSRRRYNRLGYVFYPEYESMYADNDLHDHAVKDGCLVEARHLMFPHRHPITDVKVSNDKAYLAQNRPEAYGSGKLIWEARKAVGFRQLPRGWNTNTRASVPQSPAPLSSQTALPKLAVCLPGETFGFKWVLHWTMLVDELRKYFRVMPVFGYSSSVGHTRATMLNEALTVDPDFLLWIDDDNLVTWRDVYQLIEDLNETPEADCAAGWCWTVGKDSIEMSAGYFDEDGLCYRLRHEQVFSADAPLVQVEWTGFPLVFMRRSMVNKAGDHPFAPYLTPKHPYGFSGEDVSFCRHAKERGQAFVIVDRRVEVPHLKEGALGLSTTYAKQSPQSQNSNVLAAAVSQGKE